MAVVMCWGKKEMDSCCCSMGIKFVMQEKYILQTYCITLPPMILYCALKILLMIDLILNVLTIIKNIKTVNEREHLKRKSNALETMPST